MNKTESFKSLKKKKKTADFIKNSLTSFPQRKFKQSPIV